MGPLQGVSMTKDPPGSVRFQATVQCPWFSYPAPSPLTRLGHTHQTKDVMQVSDMHSYPCILNDIENHLSLSSPSSSLIPKNLTVLRLCDVA